ncbi:XdhC family protein [Microbulbifer yueqingensis]|uniref:Xanthine dehydrogenase accessory factor n=1 Tax=Microbulbifer yueqingensis TaxID=658219 RepID=A0A1G8VAN0_9GAMM|nr:XdhC family protein [Microbulbifer yueqingensis]SDJ63131.1 xanthine dehydrogenase accessory factor [Microbulbifer yueqingensis]
MANQIATLLDQWYEHRDSRAWVLGTVFRTAGPCYRKAGAMMLFDELGRHYGLLSGGCLEGDIQRHAQRVMQSGRARALCYDGSDEDDFAFQLGIGCGGKVEILLQPVLSSSEYLGLGELRQHLHQRQPCYYLQKIPTSGEAIAQVLLPDNLSLASRAELLRRGDGQWLRTPVPPVPHILVMGAGVDARPMARLFRTQGWRVSLCDPRPANGRAAYFPGCECYSCPPGELSRHLDLGEIDAAVLMSHNLELDAAALVLLQERQLRYLGLLGPVSRRDRVLALAGLSPATLVTPLRGPIGLDIGGELPESIALSTCAEIHAAFYGGRGDSLTAATSAAPRATRDPAETD